MLNLFKKVAVSRRRHAKRSTAVDLQPLEIRLYLSAIADQFENDDISSKAKPVLTNGTVQNRSIHAAADVDWAKFVVSSPSRVEIETKGASGDSWMALYSASNVNQYITYDDDGGEGSFSKLVAYLDPGSYFIKIQEYGQNSTIDNYTLRVSTRPQRPDSFESDDIPGTAKTVTVNSVAKTHSLHNPSDVDWVRFSLSTAMRLTVSTTGPVGGDTYLELFSAENTSQSLKYNDNKAGDSYSEILAYLEKGTYFAKVHSGNRSDGVAAYQLSVSGVALSTLWDNYEPDDTPSKARPITRGTAAQVHNIHQPKDADWVKFVLASPGEAVITTDGTSGDTRLFLYKSTDLANVIASDDDGGNGSFSKITKALGAGTYYAKVQHYTTSQTIERYTLSLNVLPPSDLSVISGAPEPSGPFSPGEEVTVNWSVKNLGPNLADPGRVGNPDWSDRVYFSRDRILSSDDAALLTNRYDGTGVAKNAVYSNSMKVRLPTSMDLVGSIGWLILVADVDQQVADVSRLNNLRLVPIRFATMTLQSPVPGELVDSKTRISVAGATIRSDVSYTADIALDNDSNPANGVVKWLAQSRTVTNTSVTLATALLTGISVRTEPYYVYSRTRRVDNGATTYSRPIPIQYVSVAATSVDALRDTVGGSSYEVFGIAASRLNRTLSVVVRTNFEANRTGSSTGGDLKLIVGGKTYGLAVNNRTIANNVQVLAGALYKGASFKGGTTVRTVPTFIDTFTSRIVGRSSVSVVPTPGRPWLYEIRASLDLGALAEYRAGRTITASWAMYCGNDTDDVVIKPDDPDISLLTASRTAAGKIEFGYAVTGSVGAFNVSAYYSADQKFDPGIDTLASSGTVAATTDSSNRGSIAFPVTPAGNKPFLVIVADPWTTSNSRGVVAETDDKANNVRAIQISNRDIDLLRASWNGISFSDASPGARIQLQMSVTAYTGNAKVRFYQSENSVHNPAVDKLLDEQTIRLSSSGNQNVEVILHKTPIEGSRPKFIHIVIDPDEQIADVDRTNNRFALAVSEPGALSFELESESPIANTRLERVQLWLHKYKTLISSQATTRRIAAEAIAGAIAWEAINNVKTPTVAVYGPGKVHPTELSGEAVSEAVERLGYVPNITFASRVFKLRTVAGSIEYIGAIMYAYSQASLRAGSKANIANKPGILTTLYQGIRDPNNGNADVRLDSTVDTYFNFKVRNGDSYLPNARMGTWVEDHFQRLRDAIS